MPTLLPHDASLHGHRVDGVLRFLTVSTGAAFTVMALILLVAVLFHRGGARQAQYTHGTRRRDRAVALIAGAVVLFGIDAVAVWRSSQHLRAGFWNMPDADPQVFRVEVTAQQWSWTFRYPGADGQFGTADDVTSLNELRVPVDRPISLQLTSKDVVHAMYLPNFRNKIDAVPGTVTRMWFQARETGQFEIGCAQHCGAWHYKMRGVLIVLAEDAFARWWERAQDTAARAMAVAAVDAKGATAAAAPAAAAPVAGAAAPVEPAAARAAGAAAIEAPDAWPWIATAPR
jgi:cytochrome c oxidase subunit II